MTESGLSADDLRVSHLLRDDALLLVAPRRAILRALSVGELTAGQLADLHPVVTRPATSQHLTILAEAGLVKVRKAGTCRWYSVDLAALRRLFLDLWIDTSA